MDLDAAPIRIARPSANLAAARAFWCDGLGLQVLYEADSSAEGGHALLMLGWPTASWHLELVEHPSANAAARPGVEDLLVIYLADAVSPDLVARLLEYGGTRVVSPNPYWERWGVTIEDPDGYRLVLSSRSWP